MLLSLHRLQEVLLLNLLPPHVPHARCELPSRLTGFQRALQSTVAAWQIYALLVHGDLWSESLRVKSLLSSQCLGGSLSHTL